LGVEGKRYKRKSWDRRRGEGASGRGSYPQNPGTRGKFFQRKKKTQKTVQGGVGGRREGERFSGRIRIRGREIVSERKRGKRKSEKEKFPTTPRFPPQLKDLRQLDGVVERSRQGGSGGPRRQGPEGMNLDPTNSNGYRDQKQKGLGK